ncbi:hypothetical protein N7520_008972 [Penicillium odoratum]|uniref:uncharacterized protein n=1 Tax=Penicillium odoratum TaxID=1167516 RepID=UPI0025485E80|nr:uncharacterized protein N7520_008972 [Penicillium odoratum]KAJ5752055.1 hypothetical protein N7520_008972 [Penicillium odoratum]
MQESTSPPSWAQTLLQQMAQSQAIQSEQNERIDIERAAQEELIRRYDQERVAQDERIRRLETIIEQLALRPTTTTGEPTPARTTVGSTPEPPRLEPVYRPKARLPDPTPFGGNTADWPTWRVTIENKLHVDGVAIGSPQDQFMYVFSRLEKLAWKNTGTFVKLRRNDGDPQTILDYLEGIYGDPNIKARAARRLHQIRQSDSMPFAKFLPRLEKEFADAGALEWHDEAKRQILLGSLNKSMTNSLMNRGIPATFSDLIARLHEISTDMDALSINTPERSHRVYAQKHQDSMDWTPTTTVNQAEFRTKHHRSGPETSRQAKWVDHEEVERRRDEGRCLRCGKLGHFIAKCPLPATQHQGPREKHLRRVQSKKARYTNDRGSNVSFSEDEVSLSEDSGKE